MLFILGLLKRFLDRRWKWAYWKTVDFTFWYIAWKYGKQADRAW